MCMLSLSHCPGFTGECSHFRFKGHFKVSHNTEYVYFSFLVFKSAQSPFTQTVTLRCWFWLSCIQSKTFQSSLKVSQWCCWWGFGRFPPILLVLTVRWMRQPFRLTAGLLSYGPSNFTVWRCQLWRHHAALQRSFFRDRWELVFDKQFEWK